MTFETEHIYEHEVGSCGRVAALHGMAKCTILRKRFAPDEFVVWPSWICFLRILGAGLLLQFVYSSYTSHKLRFYSVACASGAHDCGAIVCIATHSALLGNIVHCSMQYSTLQCNTGATMPQGVHCDTLCTLLCSTMHCSTVCHNAHNKMLCTALHCTVLHCK